jgi:hypothetical protein
LVDANIHWPMADRRNPITDSRTNDRPIIAACRWPQGYSADAWLLTDGRRNHSCDGHCVTGDRWLHVIIDHFNSGVYLYINNARFKKLKGSSAR